MLAFLKCPLPYITVLPRPSVVGTAAALEYVEAIQAVKAIQRTYNTYKITEGKNLTYRERLYKRKLHSLQRRRKHYNYIYL